MNSPIGLVTLVSAEFFTIATTPSTKTKPTPNRPKAKQNAAIDDETTMRRKTLMEL
jgi:hypothetical protein